MYFFGYIFFFLVGGCSRKVNLIKDKNTLVEIRPVAEPLEMNEFQQGKNRKGRKEPLSASLRAKRKEEAKKE